MFITQKEYEKYDLITFLDGALDLFTKKLDLTVKDGNWSQIWTTVRCYIVIRIFPEIQSSMPVPKYAHEINQMF